MTRLGVIIRAISFARAIELIFDSVTFDQNDGAEISYNWELVPTSK